MSKTGSCLRVLLAFLKSASLPFRRMSAFLRRMSQMSVAEIYHRHDQQVRRRPNQRSVNGEETHSFNGKMQAVRDIHVRCTQKDTHTCTHSHTHMYPHARTSLHPPIPTQSFTPSLTLSLIHCPPLSQTSSTFLIFAFARFLPPSIATKHPISTLRNTAKQSSQEKHPHHSSQRHRA
jgi:hypothetical protein